MKKLLSAFLLCCLCFGHAIAGVNPSSLGGPKPQYEDDSGIPAAGYQVFFTLQAPLIQSNRPIPIRRGYRQIPIRLS